ncbi:hypothetical protein SAMN05216319_0451 [Duganella sp. CF402]|uniref:hypothetical protein n=1 Tax=unclassified Duganella TaxID=2636909 RepID=UPI0008CB1406|nr:MULTISPECIES: hypothetical protein [unclassified Duganella]RZT11075.1 hypothetical protein EV582_3175 [Duganella sp. BK701]SEK82653.1 hypothetical protein SAMN05216319_0451 [Duganella sp. CF402]
MSFYSWVNLQYLDEVELDFELLKTELTAYLDEHGIHHDVLKDVEKLLTDHQAMFALYGGMIDGIFHTAARLQPDAAFGLQGRGEELRDVWVREYRAGEIVFSQGPFE